MTTFHIATKNPLQAIIKPATYALGASPMPAYTAAVAAIGIFLPKP